MRQRLRVKSQSSLYLYVACWEPANFEVVITVIHLEKCKGKKKRATPTNGIILYEAEI